MSYTRKRFRRRKQHTTPHRIPPIAIVAVCLAAAVLLTVIAGNLLKLWLDDETFRRFTAEETQPPADEQAPPTLLRVPQVNAYPFVLGGNTDEILGKTAATVALNTPDGKLLYASEVGAFYGLEVSEKIPLLESMESLSAAVPYLCGVFYASAPRQESEAVRYAAALNEASLMREFIQAGADELLLCGLPLDSASLPSVLSYLQTVKQLLNDTPVGIAFPLSLLITDEGRWVLNELENNCDFFTVDLGDQATRPATDPSDTPTNAPSDEGLSDDNTDNGDESATPTLPTASELLASCRYFISQYHMRVSVSSSQTDLIEQMERSLQANFMILP